MLCIGGAGTAQSPRTRDNSSAAGGCGEEQPTSLLIHMADDFLLLSSSEQVALSVANACLTELPRHGITAPSGGSSSLTSEAH
jgi:hypothetical protein